MNNKLTSTGLAYSPAGKNTRPNTTTNKTPHTGSPGAPAEPTAQKRRVARPPSPIKQSPTHMLAQDM
eukprot:2033291-Lingulodinium_polyedra.AAC.1